MPRLSPIVLQRRSKRGRGSEVRAGIFSLWVVLWWAAGLLISFSIHALGNEGSRLRFVKADVLKIRKGRGFSQPIIGEARVNTPVMEIERDGGWSKVLFVDNDDEGWAPTRFFSKRSFRPRSVSESRLSRLSLANLERRFALNEKDELLYSALRKRSPKWAAEREMAPIVLALCKKGVLRPQILLKYPDPKSVEKEAEPTSSKAELVRAMRGRAFFGLSEAGEEEQVFRFFSTSPTQVYCSLENAWYFSSPVLSVLPVFRNDLLSRTKKKKTNGFHQLVQLKYATHSALVVVDELGIQDVQGVKVPLTRREIWHKKENIHRSWLAQASPPLSLKMVDHPRWRLLLHYGDDVDGLVIVRAERVTHIRLLRPLQKSRKVEAQPRIVLLRRP